MVWPALLPPWLRTITSALFVSTSMILPFPSSPHCAPTRIVFAISIQTRAKIFPTHLARRSQDLPTNDKNRPLPCKRFSMHAFQASVKKSDHPPRRLRRKDDAHYSIDHSDYSIARSFTHMAIQRRLGLLSKRRTR